MPDSEGPSALLFWIFAVTIAAVRLWLYFRPRSGPTLLGFRVHHYTVGLLGLWISALAQWQYLYAISLGLVVDELTFLALRGETHEDNYSMRSLAGTVVLVAGSYVLQEVLFRPVI